MKFNQMLARVAVSGSLTGAEDQLPGLLTYMLG